MKNQSVCCLKTKYVLYDWVIIKIIPRVTNMFIQLEESLLKFVSIEHDMLQLIFKDSD